MIETNQPEGYEKISAHLDQIYLDLNFARGRYDASNRDLRTLVPLDFDEDIFNPGATVYGMPIIRAAVPKPTVAIVPEGGM